MRIIWSKREDIEKAGSVGQVKHEGESGIGRRKEEGECKREREREGEREGGG